MIRAAAASAVLLSAATAAQAADIKLSDLLSKGFEIKGMTVVPADIVQRALSNPAATDELVMVLQRTGEVAFCHYLYSATFNNETIPDATCFEPVGGDAQPVAAPAAPPAASAASSSLPLSSASSAQ